MPQAPFTPADLPGHYVPQAPSYGVGAPLTPQQFFGLASQAGIPSSEQPTFYGIAVAESGLHAQGAVGPVYYEGGSPHQAFGLVQISDVNFGQYSERQVENNPLVNLEIAQNLYKTSGIAPWAASNNLVRAQATEEGVRLLANYQRESSSQKVVVLSDQVYPKSGISPPLSIGFPRLPNLNPLQGTQSLLGKSILTLGFAIGAILVAFLALNKMSGGKVLEVGKVAAAA